MAFLMKELGATQEDVAVAAGVSQVAVSKYLKGRIPRAETLVALSGHFMGIEVADLLYRDLSLGPGMKSKRLPSPPKSKHRPTVGRLNHRLERLSDEDAERVAKVCLAILDTMENPLKLGPTSTED